MIGVKVCGMREPGNIREVLELRPDYIGFIFFPASSRFVGSSFAVTPEMGDFGKCRRVGVFVDQQLPDITAAVKAADLQVVQLHGSESSEFCSLVRARHPEVEIWKAIPVGPGFSMDVAKNYAGAADALLFDTRSDTHGGSGKAFDWSLIAGYRGLPVIVSGGIGPKNVASAAALAKDGLPLLAVDLNSKFETAPGIKSPELLACAFGELRA